MSQCLVNEGNTLHVAFSEHTVPARNHWSDRCFVKSWEEHADCLHRAKPQYNLGMHNFTFEIHARFRLPSGLCQICSHCRPMPLAIVIVCRMAVSGVIHATQRLPIVDGTPTTLVLCVRGVKALTYSWLYKKATRFCAMVWVGSRASQVFKACHSWALRREDPGCRTMATPLIIMSDQESLSGVPLMLALMCAMLLAWQIGGVTG